MTSRAEKFILRATGEFAGLALADLMAGPLTEKGAHFPAKAKHCVFLFMNGGPSQVDTFDPKPRWRSFTAGLTLMRMRRWK